MKLHMFLIFAVVMSLFSTAAMAADVNGKWTAEMKTPDEARPALRLTLSRPTAPN